MDVQRELHGIGAETPCQCFSLTANLGGTSRGMLGLAAFALGVANKRLDSSFMGRAQASHHVRFYSLIA